WLGRLRVEGPCCGVYSIHGERVGKDRSEEGRSVAAPLPNRTYIDARREWLNPRMSRVIGASGAILLVFGLIFDGGGVLLLLGSLPRDPRWPSTAHRLVAILTAVAMLLLGSGLVAGAWTSGSTRRD